MAAGMGERIPAELCGCRLDRCKMCNPETARPNKTTSKEQTTPAVCSSVLLVALQKLAEEWDKQHDFLNNPHDCQADKFAGVTYRECANALRDILGN